MKKENEHSTSTAVSAAAAATARPSRNPHKKKQGGARGNVPTVSQVPTFPTPIKTGTNLGKGKDNQKSFQLKAERERAKADVVFATTSSQWYAGAAFDRSPAAHTLPKPSKLLNTNSSKAAASSPVLATSCPPAGFLSSMSERPHLSMPTSPPQGSSISDDPNLSPNSGDLRAKSRNLLSYLRGGEIREPSLQAQSNNVMDSNKKDEELQAMTHDLRKLLNLKNS